MHRSLGLALGFLMAIVGLTGGITVYQPEFEARLDPALHYVEPGTDLASFETIIEAALAAYPDRRVFALGPNDGRPRMAYWLELRKDGEKDTHVLVNPYTAEVLGARAPWTLPGVIRRLHTGLFMGRIGTYLLGLTSIGMLVALVAGVVLWWPAKATWRRSLTIRRSLGPRRLLFDVHNLTGACSFVFVFVLTITGAALVLPGMANDLMRVVGLSDVAAPRVPSETVADSRATFDQVVSAARGALPDHRILSIFVPQGDNGVYVFHAERTAFPIRAETVTVDQYSALVLSNTRLPTGNGIGAAVEGWVSAIHAGRVLGSPSRLVTFLAGLALPLLFGSGTYMWYRNRTRR